MISKYAIWISLALIGSEAVCQEWTGIGEGFNRTVRSIYVDSVNSTIYSVGGFSKANTFGTAGSTWLMGVAEWNGASWDSMQCGMDNQCIPPSTEGQYPGNVVTITKFGGNIYAGGAFNMAGGIAANSIATWDGGQWDSVGSGANAAVAKLEVINGELYVLGSFDTIAGIPASKIARWNGSVWNTYPVLDPATGGWAIGSAEYYKNELYVGGNFVGSGGPNMADIARWDGANWNSVGNGLSGPTTHVTSFAVFRDTLYAGGYFFEANGDPGNCIAKWDGSSWTGVGTGMNAQVFDLAVFNDELYACGQFTLAGGVSVSYIAKWDGSQWLSLNVNFDNTVSVLTVMDTVLLVGGGFNTVNGFTTNGIAQYCPNTLCVDTTNILDHRESNLLTLNIFPNPTTSLVTVSYLPEESSRMFVYNILGDLVRERELNGANELSLDLSGLPVGLYLFQLECGLKTFSNKVLKH